MTLHPDPFSLTSRFDPGAAILAVIFLLIVACWHLYAWLHPEQFISKDYRSQ